MKILSLVCLSLLLTVTARADGLPYFSTLRAEVENQLTIASNTPPLNKKLIATLKSNLKLIDRTKPTLVNGSAALGVLAKGLGRTAPSNTFLPILTATRDTYANDMEFEAAALEIRLDDTIPGKVQTAAQTAINKLRAAIDNSRTNANFTLALRSLSTAAKAVAAAQKAVFKAENARPGASFLTATITESNQGTTTLVTPRSVLYATYDSFSGELIIDGGDAKNLGGGRYQGRVLTLIASLADSGEYTLSLTNVASAYAYYERGIYSNINAEEPTVEFYELYPTFDPPPNNRFGTGTLTITLDLEANIAWGEFTFTATGNTNASLTVAITGSFLVRLETF